MCGTFDAIGSFFQSPAGKIVTAVAAIGIAAITGNPFAIIAAVGATVGAIGSVTGNQTLSTVGSVIGAVGLVGGLADASGLISSADIFGTSNVFSGGAGIATAANDAGAGATAAETANPFSSAATSGYSNVGDLMAGEGIGGTSNTSVMDGITSQVIPPTGAVPTAEAPTVTPAAAVDTTVPGTASGSTTATLASQGVPTSGIVNQPPGATPSIDQEISQWSQYGAPTPPVTGTPASLNADGSLINPKDAGIPGSFNGAQAAANAYGPATGPVPTTPSAWDTISTWLEGHPTMALGALMAGGSFLSGATSPLTPAQVSALQAQAIQNQAAANLANQQASASAQQQQLLGIQQSNMLQPLPVASRTPTPPVGLINQPRLAPVTGQVSV